MSGFKLRRLAMLMEPEPGNPQEIEGVLIRPPLAARTVNFTCSRAWLRGEITRASALPEYGSMKPAIRQALSGSASHWNRKPIMSAARRQWRLRGSPHHVCGTASALHNDLHGVFVPWPTDRPGNIAGFVSLEATGARDLC